MPRARFCGNSGNLYPTSSHSDECDRAHLNIPALCVRQPVAASEYEAPLYGMGKMRRETARFGRANEDSY